MANIGARKPTYSEQLKLVSYVLTIHLGKGDSDLQTPFALWVILGWFKASAGITIKEWLSNILWLLVSVRKSIQLLKFCQYYCFNMVLIMHGGDMAQSTSQTISKLAYVRKKAQNLGRKIECTYAQMIWNLLINIKCGIYIGKVGWNICEFEKTLCWYLLFAGSKVERTRS